MATFPTNGDYVQALQHPEACFHDQDLKAGSVTQTRLGLPRAISGNFASIFSITGASGKRYAVKCFTRQVNGQHQRYKAIHDLLAGLGRPWQVGFEYLTQGVLVDGQWHAILRMEWVENSQTLIPWLENHLGTPDRILDVAYQFAACMADLNAAGIAHGDLQHGNLLIDADDKLRLIDYDGMFVPSIAGLGSNEVGLANYQHPGRSGSDFGPELDRFSAWLIYGSLLSLAAQPGLWWTTRQAGDEKLLFGKEDFVPPLNAIQQLKLLGSPHAEVAEILVQAITSAPPLTGVPEFDPERISLPKQAPALSITHGSSQDATSAWWQQTSTTTAGQAPADEATSSPRLGAGWLRSHETPLPPVEVVGPGRAAKAMGLVISTAAVLGAAFAGVQLNLATGGLILLTWAMAMTIGIWMLWRRSDVALGRAAARRATKSARREVARQQSQVTKAQSARAALDQDERRALQKLQDQRTALPKSSASEFDRESKKLRKQLTTLEAAFNRLDAEKATETQQQLKTLQEQHIYTYLASRRIEAGDISGIGSTLVTRLAVYGLRTAADIAAINGSQIRLTGSSSWITIPGIGPSKAFSIRVWHQRQVDNAESSAPKSLSKQQIQVIDNKYKDKKRQQQAAIDVIKTQLGQLRATIDVKYTALDQEIAQKADTVRVDYQRQRSAADANVAQAITQLHTLEAALLDAERDLARYRDVAITKYLAA